MASPSGKLLHPPKTFPDTIIILQQASSMGSSVRGERATTAARYCVRNSHLPLCHRCIQRPPKHPDQPLLRRILRRKPTGCRWRSLRRLIRQQDPWLCGTLQVIPLSLRKANRIAQVTIFSLSVFVGPMVAPFIGGFIVTSHLGWRWTMYLSGILASAAAVSNFFFPVQNLRASHTGNQSK